MQGNKGNSQSGKQLAMLGHELRNVLNGMLGASQLLSKSSLSGEQQQILESLQQSAGQLGWLIESLNPVGGVAEFPFTPIPVVINGVDLLEQAIRCHTPAAASNKNLLLLMVEPGLPAWWRTDAYLLRLVIDNLLANAIKFSRCGEVMIEARRPAGEGQSDFALELRVTDKGPGISKKHSQRIFEPWVQLKKGRDMGGSGLGLHVCQRIVSSLQGEIAYSREAGSANCFQVSLPQMIDPQLCWHPIQASKLFASMCCLLSAPAELCRSLEMLLARLGIRTGPEAMVPDCKAGADLQILIKQAEFSKPEVDMKNCLILSQKMAQQPGARLPVSRFLQAPFLESTLGPLLMEMALEISAQSSRPVSFPPGDKPD